MVMYVATRPTRLLSSLALVAGLAIGSQTNVFAAECKGMEKGPCENQDSCSWVDGYTRKDGVKVSGHCRSKGGKKSSSSSDSKSSASSS